MTTETITDYETTEGERDEWICHRCGYRCGEGGFPTKVEQTHGVEVYYCPWCSAVL